MLQNMRTTTKIRIGQQSNTTVIGSDGVEIPENEILVVDVSKSRIKIGDVMVHIPSLPSMIKMKWLVPEGDVHTVYVPPSTATAIPPIQSPDEEPQMLQVNSGNAKVDSKALSGRVASAGSDGTVVSKVRGPGTHVVISADNMGDIERALNGPTQTPVVAPIHGLNDNQGTIVSRVPTNRTAAQGVKSSVPETGITMAPQKKGLGKSVEGVYFPTSEVHDDYSDQYSDQEVESGSVQYKGKTSTILAQSGDEPLDFVQKLRLIQTVIPGFTWDLTRPWKERVGDAVRNHAKNSPFLIAVLAVESENVKAHILKNIKY